MAVLGIVLLSPLALLIIIRIKGGSDGPVFFHGERVGKDGKRFKIIKFRTMYEAPESYNGNIVTAQDDPRITPVGKWLRDTKLNELPQLWNIIKGDMSLVGPRPEDPHIVSQWTEGVRKEILSVRPGITSAASVLYRDEESLLENDTVMNTYMNTILPDKLRLDQLYVRHRSFWLDLDILFWTMLVVVPSLWPIDPLEGALFWGPFSRLMQRYVNWFSIDTVTTFAAFATVSVLWRSTGPLNVGWPRMFGLAVGFSLLFSVVGAVIGIQRIQWGKALARDVLYLLASVGIAMLVALLINQILAVLPSVLLIYASGLAFVGYVFVRYRSRLITGLVEYILSGRDTPAIAKERVLIIGGGDAGQYAANLLIQYAKSDAFKIVGFIDDDYFIQGSRIRGSRVIGKRNDIPSLVDKLDIGLIVYAIHNISKTERQKLLDICGNTPAKVIELPDYLGAMNELLFMRNMPLDPAQRDVLEIYPMSTNGTIAKTELLRWLHDLNQLVQEGNTEEVHRQLREIEIGLRKME